MEHRTEGELLAFLDDELTLARRVEVENHLTRCDRCAAELDTLRRASSQLTDALAAIDGPAPVAATATAASAVTRRVGPSLHRPPRRIPLLRAAVLVLCFGGAASAAIPGSPVRGWVIGGWEQAAQLWRDEPQTDVAAAESLAAERESPSRQRSYSTLPEDGSIRILLQRLGPDVEDLRIRWVESSHGAVSALTGAEEPKVRVAGGSLRVEGGLADEVVIELPWQLDYASIEVDGRTLFTTDRDEIAPPESRRGTELVLPLEP